MNGKAARIATYVGIALAGLHTVFAGYSFYLVEVVYAGDGQAAMDLIPLAFVDLPVTALIFGCGYVFAHFSSSALPQWFLPLSFLSIGGIFWFSLPRFFLTAEEGGFWGRRKPSNPTDGPSSE